MCFFIFSQNFMDLCYNSLNMSCFLYISHNLLCFSSFCTYVVFSAFLLLFLHHFGDPPCGHWFPRTLKKALRADLGSHGPPQTALRADLGSHGLLKRPCVRTLVLTDPPTRYPCGPWFPPFPP